MAHNYFTSDIVHWGSKNHKKKVHPLGLELSSELNKIKMAFKKSRYGSHYFQIVAELSC